MKEQMSPVHDDASSNAKQEQVNRLERARAATNEFCHRFSFPASYLDQCSGDPIQKPLVIDRNGVSFEVFRWLGHGRGAPYVQVEISLETDDVIVYGGFNDREFGPWKKP